MERSEATVGEEREAMSFDMGFSVSKGRVVLLDGSNIAPLQKIEYHPTVPIKKCITQLN